MAAARACALLDALRAEAAAVGPEEAFSRACAGWAQRCGLRLPAAWEGGQPSAVLSRAVEGVPEEDLPEPARVLGAALEMLLEGSGGKRHARKRTGAYYTPAPLVDHVLSTALDPIAGGVSPDRGVLDPACGSGVFLVGAVRRLLPGRDAATAAACVSGMDIQPVAVLLARFSVWLACGGAAPASLIEERIRVGDALLVEDARRYDAVVGNPPFLNQLEVGTAHGRARAAALRERYGDAARGYADSASIFLAMALRRVRAGGRVALVQPQSLLAARDAEPARRAALEAGALTDLWLAREHLFGANVLVCVPTIAVGTAQGAVRVRAGADFAEVRSPAEPPAPRSWAPLVAGAHGIPEFLCSLSGTLGDYAAATADFRDQFYGLRGSIVEGGEEADLDDALFPRLVTTGLVDPACCRWGDAPTRIDGARWLAPRVDLRRLSTDPDMARWARARLTPKVLLATQTRVLEAAVDPEGAWLPVTPLITVVPRDPHMLWALAAALASPVLTAIALREYAGAGLSASAIKLSAKQVLRLPAPADVSAWRRGGEMFRAASEADAPSRPGLLLQSGLQMCRAYGVPDEGELMRWWAERLPARKVRSAAAVT